MLSTKSLLKFTLLGIVAFLIIAPGGQNHATFARQAQAQDQMLADSGFRPDKNGFGFENYGNSNKPVNLTPADVRALFGDQVCGAVNGDTCTLIPPAQQWMDELNNGMDGGHCDGMAAVSLLMYSGKLKPSDYGQDSIVALPFTGNDKLTRTIAYYFSTQTTAPSYSGIVEGTPSEIVNRLIDAFKNNTEQYAVSLRKRDNTGGHAITPYAIVDKGNNIVWIMVYDNNFPKAERYIEVDRGANTWKYTASTNPNEPSALYEGDADTKTLRLKPMSPRLQQQICEFCAAKAASQAPEMVKAILSNKVSARVSVKSSYFADTSVQYNEIMLQPHQADNKAQLLITDDQGHKLGFQGGKLYTEIPGAVVTDVDSADLFTDNPSPVYRVPVGIKFTVTIDGSLIKQTELTDISMFGPGYDLAVEDIKVDPGDADTMTFSPDGKQISYKPSASEAPTIVLGIEHSGADYEFELTGATIEKGAAINASLDYDTGRLGIHVSGGQNASTYGLVVRRIDSAEETFGHDGLSLDSGATDYVEFAKWDGKGDMPLSISSKSDGTIDKTATAPNDKK